MTLPVHAGDRCLGRENVEAMHLAGIILVRLDQETATLTKSLNVHNYIILMKETIGIAKRRNSS